MRTVVRRAAPLARPLYCDCTRLEGFTQPVERPGWWVRACCMRPAKTYLDAMDEQGHEWEPLA